MVDDLHVGAGAGGGLEGREHLRPLQLVDRGTQAVAAVLGFGDETEQRRQEIARQPRVRGRAGLVERQSRKAFRERLRRDGAAIEVDVVRAPRQRLGRRW